PGSCPSLRSYWRTWLPFLLIHCQCIFGSSVHRPSGEHVQRNEPSIKRTVLSSLPDIRGLLTPRGSGLLLKTYHFHNTVPNPGQHYSWSYLAGCRSFQPPDSFVDG